jgi:hypothetical protein
MKNMRNSRRHSMAFQGLSMTYDHSESDERSNDDDTSSSSLCDVQVKGKVRSASDSYLGDLASMLMPPKIVDEVIPVGKPRVFQSRRLSCSF